MKHATFENKGERTGLLAALGVAVLLAVPAPALAGKAGSGDLDPAFGTDGVAVTGASISGVSVHTPDGRIVTGGAATVARYLADGTPDAGFGSGGTASLPMYPGVITDVAVQADGKVLVSVDTSRGAVGQDGHFTLVRFDAAGNLDAGFGSGGVVTTMIGSADSRIDRVAVQPDGSIVAAGDTAVWVYQRTWSRDAMDFAVARYLPDGSLDASFGSGGVVQTDIAGDSDNLRGMALAADGGIVAGGATYTGNIDGNDYALVRYLADGSLDTAFGSGGVVTTHINGPNESLADLVVQADGKVVAAGYSSVGPGTDADYVVARYNADGSLDASFSGGLVITDIGGGNDYGTAVGVQSDGSVVVAGNFTVIDKKGTTLGIDVGVVRLGPDGARDTRYGDRGLTQVDLGDDRAADLEVLQNDAVVIGGSALFKLLP